MVKKKPAHWSRHLRKLGACSDAITWARKQRSPSTAWKKCQRADWMLWAIEHLNPDEAARAKLRTIAYAAATRAVKIHAPMALEAAGIPIEAAKLRALPDITDNATALAAMDAAKDAARNAASYAAMDAAWDAAWAARNAAWDAAMDAAWDAAWAARNAAWDAAMDAAWDAAWAAAMDAELAFIANLVREHFPQPPKIGRPA